MSGTPGPVLPPWFLPRLEEFARTGKWSLWETYVYACARATATGAPPTFRESIATQLVTHAAGMTDHTFWYLVGRLLHFAPCPTIYALLDSPRPGRESMLRPLDRLVMAGLPSEFALWRGSYQGAPLGRWWSLGREEAELNALLRSSACGDGYAGGSPALWRIDAHPAEVAALFLQGTTPFGEFVLRSTAAPPCRIDWTPDPALTELVNIFVRDGYVGPVFGGQLPARQVDLVARTRSPDWVPAVARLRCEAPGWWQFFARLARYRMHGGHETDEEAAAALLAEIRALGREPEPGPTVIYPYGKSSVAFLVAMVLLDALQRAPAAAERAVPAGGKLSV